MRIEDLAPIEIRGAEKTDATLFAHVPWNFGDYSNCKNCAFRDETLRFCQNTVMPVSGTRCGTRTGVFIRHTQEALEELATRVAVKRLGAANET